MFLGGPPLVKMATGEDSDDEELGGADDALARSPACRDYFAARRARLHPHRPRDRRRISTGASSGRAPTHPVDEPLLRSRRAARHRVGRPPGAVRSARGDRAHRRRLALRGVQAALRHEPRVTGWASIHGYPVGILANATACCSAKRRRRRPSSSCSCNQIDTPLVFLQNTTGYMVGTRVRAGGHHQGRRQDDQRGHELDGAAPHRHHGRVATAPATTACAAARTTPRFLFTWPNAKIAVMGPQAARGRDVDRARAVGRVQPGARSTRRPTPRSGKRSRSRSRHESIAFFTSGRSVRRRHHRSARHPHGARHRAVGRALERRRGRRGFGVFRM